MKPYIPFENAFHNIFATILTNVCVCIVYKYIYIIIKINPTKPHIYIYGSSSSYTLFFFDKSICYIKKRKRGATLSTLGVYKGDQGEKEKKVRKSTKLIARGASQPVVQEKRVTRKKWRSSSRVLGEASKHLSFRSLQMHHKIQ
jgi:hypothetical protein